MNMYNIEISSLRFSVSKLVFLYKQLKQQIYINTIISLSVQTMIGDTMFATTKYQYSRYHHIGILLLYC
jgi:hypothetical protein